jgi:hypothetical protein
MDWQLTNRRGIPLTAGTLEQVLYYLKFLVKDGEYRLVRGDTTVYTIRHQGILYPFDQWEGYTPMEVVQQLRLRDQP